MYPNVDKVHLFVNQARSFLRACEIMQDKGWETLTDREAIIAATADFAAINAALRVLDQIPSDKAG